MGVIVSKAESAPRSIMLLFAIFAALAIALGAVGIYGVMSYSVWQRTREIGVRIALGAESATVLRMVLVQGMKLALLGVTLGLAASLALTQIMKSMLYGVTPSDPLTFLSVTAMLVVIALAACYIPARRAMRVDPMVALRDE
jgi:ABC-type antimicrobial peptide transport system permease subunit